MQAMLAMPDLMPGQALPPMLSHDGLLLFRRQWSRQEAGGSILLVHGLGEHSGRYLALANWFWQRGYNVLAYDQRGHGRSGGRRGSLPRPDDLLRDLVQVYTHFAASQPAPPWLLGHSMGGLVCVRTVLQRGLQPAGLILSAPALQSRVGPVLQRLASWLARLAPGLPLGQGLPKQFLSHDPAVALALRSDPYCHNRITPALAEFIFKAGAASQREAPHLSTPTLLLVAGQDQLVDSAGSLAFAARAPTECLQTQVFAGAYHELFNEIASIREPVLAVLADWLDTKGRK